MQSEKTTGRTVCFTGQNVKSLCGFNHDSYLYLVKQLKSTVLDMVTKMNVTRFITFGAQGFEQLVFWAVQALRTGKIDGNKYPHVENVVMLPCNNYGHNWSKTGTFGRKQLEMIKAQATSVIYNETYDKPLRRKDLTDAIKRCHVDAIAQSDMCFALSNNKTWNDPQQIVYGNVTEFMRWAYAYKKPLYQINYDICTGDDGTKNITVAKMLKYANWNEENINQFIRYAHI